MEEQCIEVSLDSCLHEVWLEMSICDELGDSNILIEKHRCNRLNASIGWFMLSHLDARS